MRTLKIYEIGVDPLPKPGTSIWLLPMWDSKHNPGAWGLTPVELIFGVVTTFHPADEDYDPAKVCIDEADFYDDNGDFYAHGLRIDDLDIDLLRGQLWVKEEDMLRATAPSDRGGQ